MPLVQTLMALPAAQFVLCLARCAARLLLLALASRLAVAERSASESVDRRRRDTQRRRFHRGPTLCPHCRTPLSRRLGGRKPMTRSCA